MTWICCNSCWRCIPRFPYSEIEPSWTCTCWRCRLYVMVVDGGCLKVWSKSPCFLKESVSNFFDPRVPKLCILKVLLRWYMDCLNPSSLINTELPASRVASMYDCRTSLGLGPISREIVSKYAFNCRKACLQFWSHIILSLVHTFFVEDAPWSDLRKGRDFFAPSIEPYSRLLTSVKFLNVV